MIQSLVSTKSQPRQPVAVRLRERGLDENVTQALTQPPPFVSVQQAAPQLGNQPMSYASNRLSPVTSHQSRVTST
jgi:hypothetical protein